MKKTASVKKVISKPALRYVVRSLPEKEFKLNWNHEDKKSTLSIYDYETKQMSVATFQNGDKLVFQHLDSTNPRIITVFEEIIGAPLKDQFKRSAKTLYMEMDYHLLELYEYIQTSDRENIKQTKAKLVPLREEFLHITSHEAASRNVTRK